MLRNTQDARTTAIRVFSNHLVNNSSRQVQRNNITLKYGARRADGSGVWAAVELSEWSTILSTDGEEIGVFTSDNANAPYTAAAGVSSSLEAPMSSPQAQRFTRENVLASPKVRLGLSSTRYGLTLGLHSLPSARSTQQKYKLDI